MTKQEPVVLTGKELYPDILVPVTRGDTGFIHSRSGGCKVKACGDALVMHLVPGPGASNPEDIILTPLAYSLAGAPSEKRPYASDIQLTLTPLTERKDVFDLVLRIYYRDIGMQSSLGTPIGRRIPNFPAGILTRAKNPIFTHELFTDRRSVSLLMDGSEFNAQTEAVYECEPPEGHPNGLELYLRIPRYPLPPDKRLSNPIVGLNDKGF